MSDEPDQDVSRLVVAVEVEDTPWCATGSELVADRLFSLGASAVSEMDRDLPVGDQRQRLVADLPVAALDALTGAGLTFALLEVDPTWNDTWRDHAVAVPVGERLILRPEWVPAVRSPGGLGDRIEVVLDAADSFGSGSHPTTRLCLAAVERLVQPGDRVLDVGSGTGVLGVGALLLGAGSLVAVDVDPAAVIATRRTAELNGVVDRVVEVSDRRLGDVVDELGPFDLVVANLLIPIIEDLGPDLSRAVAPGGRLVLGGLLDDTHDHRVGRGELTANIDRGRTQVDRAITAAGLDMALLEVARGDGWAAVVLADGSDAHR